jgi:hypothetical protein
MRNPGRLCTTCARIEASSGVQQPCSIRKTPALTRGSARLVLAGKPKHGNEAARVIQTWTTCTSAGLPTHYAPFVVGHGWRGRTTGHTYHDREITCSAPRLWQPLAKTLLPLSCIQPHGGRSVALGPDPDLAAVVSWSLLQLQPNQVQRQSCSGRSTCPLHDGIRT